jgi:multicomponent Na+:H+ antiporter subunit D
MLRPALLAYRTPPKPPAFNEAPFPMLLGIGLAVFFCLSVGVAPGWLYGLLPAELTFRPYEIDRTAPQLELLGAAGATYVLLYASRLAPRELPLRLLDVDALYRGPLAGAGRWLGVVLLRLYGSWQALFARLAESATQRIARLAREFDRPYRRSAWGAVQLLAYAAAILLALFWRHL